MAVGRMPSSILKSAYPGRASEPDDVTDIRDVGQEHQEGLGTQNETKRSPFPHILSRGHLLLKATDKLRTFTDPPVLELLGG